MKRKNLFVLAIITLCLTFTSKVFAEEITTIEVGNALSSADIIYGDEVNFNIVNQHPDKYTVVEYLCKNDELEELCVTSDNINSLANIKPGTWTYGLRIAATNGNTLAENLTWKFDGNDIDPLGKGETADGKFGADFYDVEAKDWEVKISGITITNVKKDFKVGDAVTFTGTPVDAYKDKYTFAEGWCDSIDGAFGKGKCTFSNGSKTDITKFEAKKYYYIVSYFRNNPAYMFNSQNFSVNGTAYNAGDMSGVADYSFGTWVPFSIDLSNAEEVTVKPVDTNNEDAKNTAKEVSSVVTKALEELKENKEVTGMSKETAEKVKAALENGKEIKTEVKAEVVKGENVSDEVKKLVDEKVDDKSKILGYFDINLLVKTDDETLGKITELGNKIKVTIDAKDLVANLPKVEDGLTRVYQIVRIHDGVAEIINATLNSDGTLTFETDRFSDYILTYKDVKETNPNTLDNINLSIILGSVSLIGITSIILYKKEN